MDKMLLNFGGRLGRCWTQLMRPLPKVIATLVLTILILFGVGVGMGFLVFGLAHGEHIQAENEETGLAISGACAFGIVVILSILCGYKLHRKRRNSAAAVPLREQSRTAENKSTFVEVASEKDSSEIRTPISISSEQSATFEAASISCGKESSEGTGDQLAEVEVHHESLQVVDSESDQPLKEQQVASPEEITVKEEPVSADEQMASKSAISTHQEEPPANTTLVI